MNLQSITLNVKYDAPGEIWQKLSLVYRQLDGWLDEYGSPSWFSINEHERHVWASVEPGGLLFCGLMDNEEWEQWVNKLKETATRELGYKVGDVESGEVDD